MIEHLGSFRFGRFAATGMVVVLALLCLSLASRKMRQRDAQIG